MAWSRIQLRYRRSSWWLLALMAGLAMLLADQFGLLLVRRESDFAHYHGLIVRVSSIVDGDIIDVDVRDVQAGNPVTRVRLLGVKAPNTRAQNSESLHRQACEFTRIMLTNASVRLSLEPSRVRDELGHVLAHVETLDGTDLAEALLAGGLCSVDERWPHSLLLRYSQTEREARRKMLGMWSDAASSQRNVNANQ
ncbi:MAG TPA: thermonuclease family protein [Phycisphaerales bacterium]|nr:thermonuclease family protein [Phycisphaerales bacterium]